MVRHRGLARLLAVGMVAPMAVLVFTVASPPVEAAPRCAAAGQMIKPIPWQQQVLAPERVWPLTHGGQVTVAVLASGVDADVPGLRGHVAPGFDATGSGTADDDCLGIGTQVAGVIAGQQAKGTGFSGLAPGVTILPVRVTVADSSYSIVVPADTLAKGITWATQHGADVIAAPLPAYTDSPALQSAVADALAHQVLVVAGVGDRAELSSANAGPTPYPASYPGVLGVAAIDPTGMPAGTSQYGSYVGIAAPGVGVLTLQRGGGMVMVDSTAVACGFVAATAALVRARFDDLSAAAMRHRLTATATPAGGGTSSVHLGTGIVDPYAAVTDELASANPVVLPGLPDSGKSTDVWAHSRRLAWAGAGIAVLGILAVLLVAVALPRGRRRAWRLGLAPHPVPEPEPEPGPPVLLFEDPKP